MSEVQNNEKATDVVPEAQDNLKVAVDKVAETMDMTVSNVVGDDGPSTKQIIVRTTDAEHERWKMAAHKIGKSMSQFIRDSVSAKVSETLDCQHPLNLRRYYPWAEFCLKCNTRIRG
jgi:predicted HicB family RNase H-like nuclease